MLLSIDYNQNEVQQDVEIKRLIEQSKSRAFVRWDKVWENEEKTRRIFAIKFRKFYIKDYSKQNLTIYENPQSLIFKTVKWDRLKKVNRPISTYIFTFKKNKLGFFSVVAAAPIKRRSPCDGHINKFTCSGVNFRHTELKDFPGLTKYEKRLVKLLIKKCKENKVPIPFGAENSKNLMECAQKIYYPGLSNLMEFAPNFKINYFETRGYMRHFSKPFKQSIKAITGFNSKGILKLVTEKAKEKYSGPLCSSLFVLNVLKKYITVDEAQEILKTRDKPTTYLTAIDKKSFNRFINHYTYKPKTIKKWVLEENNNYLIRDAISHYDQIIKNAPNYKLIDSNDIKEIHDILVKDWRKIQHADKPIKNEQRLVDSNIDGTVVDDVIIIIPKTTHQLIEWGTKMNNCIGGYAYHIERGYSRILGVTDLDGNILYGIDIEPVSGRLNQFRGKHNIEAPMELQEKVLAVLLEKKLYVPHFEPKVQIEEFAVANNQDTPF